MSTQEAKSPKQIIKDTINQLKDEGIYAGFPEGKKIPNFEATSTSGEALEVYDLLGDNEFVILNFFRGDWCGYCEAELEELSEYYDSIRSLGGVILSIAPQHETTLKTMKEERSLDHPIVADSDLKIARLFNIVWDIPEKIKQIYLEDFDLDIAALNANNTWELPVPATYIVNNNGDVISKFEDLDYSQRMPVQDIVSLLSNNQ